MFPNTAYFSQLLILTEIAVGGIFVRQVNSKLIFADNLMIFYFIDFYSLSILNVTSKADKPSSPSSQLYIFFYFPEYLLRIYSCFFMSSIIIELFLSYAHLDTVFSFNYYKNLKYMFFKF